MSTLWSKLETNRTLKNLYILLRRAGPLRLSGLAGLACALLLTVTPSSRPGYGLATVPRAGIKSCGNACAPGRTLVEDRERGVVARDPRARVVIANRHRRQGVRNHRNHGRQVEATTDRD